MKALMWVVAIVVVGAAAWFIWKQTAGPVTVAQLPPTEQQQTQTQPVKTGGLSTSGSTDTELDADMTQIDGQIDAAASASDSASQTDQPVKQTE